MTGVTGLAFSLPCVKPTASHGGVFFYDFHDWRDWPVAESVNLVADIRQTTIFVQKKLSRFLKSHPVKLIAFFFHNINQYLECQNGNILQATFLSNYYLA